MQRLGRIMVMVGVLATVGMGAAAVQGLRGAASDAALRMHVLIALGSLLLFLLSHIWILFYLLGALRVLRSESAGSSGDGLDPSLRSFHRHTLPPLLLAIGLALGCFLVGSGVYDGTIPAGVHALLFYLAVAAEAWAAWSEWRTFGGAERSVRRLERAEEAGTAA